MNKPLTLGSLFDGSGGFPLAGLLAGIVPVWSSEIEPFAIRVTEKRLPQVQHFGNISGLHGAKLPPVDIITFGSPCQDMSIAGKRTGLNGSRSAPLHDCKQHPGYRPEYKEGSDDTFRDLDTKSLKVRDCTNRH